MISHNLRVAQNKKIAIPAIIFLTIVIHFFVADNLSSDIISDLESHQQENSQPVTLKLKIEDPDLLTATPKTTQSTTTEHEEEDVEDDFLDKPMEKASTINKKTILRVENEKKLLKENEKIFNQYDEEEADDHAENLPDKLIQPTISNILHDLSGYNQTDVTSGSWLQNTGRTGRGPR